MGKIVFWNKLRGLEIGPTPYQCHLDGLHFFQRMRFPGLRLKHNSKRLRRRVR